jgi:ComEC/Rec2-related protein
VPRKQSRTASRPRFAVAQAFWQRVAGEAGRDQARGAAFLCLPVLMGAGAASYYSLPFEPGALSLAVAIAFLAVAAILARSKPLLLVAAATVLAFVLGFGAAKVETWRTATPMLGSEVTTRIAGRVVRIEEQASGRMRLIVDIAATERPRLRFPPQRVRLTARSTPDGLRPGDTVRGLVRLMPPSGPVRPGSYDFSFASYFGGLDAVGFFMAGPERAELAEDLPLRLRPARWLEGLRLALAERIRSHVDGPEGEVAVAIISGFRPGIPEEVNEWLRRAGLAHILAISGLHMALVALTVMVMLRAACAFFPGFVARIPVKKYAAAAALAFCTLYLFISGAAVAAQRSYIMLAVMLAALIFDRAALTMRNVAIAALIIIAWSPHEVVGPSFQLSFAATAALVAGYAAWTEWRRGRVVPHAIPPRSVAARGLRAAWGFLLGLAATSIIAGTATALYGVWHFQRATSLALPANLLAMPLVSLVAMPSAVFAMLAMPFGFDGFFLDVMGRAIAATIAVARWFSERTPVDAVGLIPIGSLLALTATLVILVVSTTWLRILAIPFMLLGMGLLVVRDLPDVLVSEDARLVAIRGAEGTLAVNRSRPNGFTIEDWTRALVAENLVKPRRGVPDAAQEGEEGSSPVFFCHEDLCLARHESGALIAHAENAAAARAVCATATLIVLDDASVENPCGGSEVTVLTKRDLARRGSAAIHLHKEEAGLRPEVLFAIGEEWRPWHAQRAWSRAARGLAPQEAKTALRGKKGEAGDSGAETIGEEE